MAQKFLKEKLMIRNSQMTEKLHDEKKQCNMATEEKQKQSRGSRGDFENCKQKQTHSQENKQLVKNIFSQQNRKNENTKAQSISPQELKTLFDFYDEYGPKWSNFEQLIPGRNQNQLKNKFHSTIRTLCRLIIITSEQHQKLYGHIPSSKISSKVLVDLYQGKKGIPFGYVIGFKKFKNFLKKMLKIMNYQVLGEDDKLEKCKQVIGVENFYKVYEELSCALGKKKKSSGSQAKKTKAIVRNISDIRPASSLLQEKNKISIKKQSEEHHSKDVKPKIEEIQAPNIRVAPEPTPSKSQAEYNEVIRKNNMEIMQKLYLANQMGLFHFSGIPLADELQKNLQRLNQNLQKYCSPQP